MSAKILVVDDDASIRLLVSDVLSDQGLSVTTAASGEEALTRLVGILSQLPRRAAIEETPPPLPRPRRVMAPREAMLSLWEELPLEECQGRVLASVNVSCPPAVPILVCGEEIDKMAVECFQYYGVSRCEVVKET